MKLLSRRSIGGNVFPVTSCDLTAEGQEGVLSFYRLISLGLTDVEQTNADVRIPAHRESTTDTLELTRAARNRACRKSDDRRESVFVLVGCLPLICSGCRHVDGSTVKRVMVTLVPGSIARRVRSAGSVVGDGALVGHRDLTDGLSGAIFFLANNIVGVVWVRRAGVEV